MDWIAVAMEEYKTLRQESQAAIDRQERVLASGTAVTALVLGVGANAARGSTVSIVLLLVLAPLLACLVTIMWLGEVERMLRAGAYVSLIEQRVNSEFHGGKPALGWESFLRRRAPGGRRILWLYRAVFAILLSLASASAILGAAGLVEHGAIWVVVGGVVAGSLLIALTCVYVGSEMRFRAMGGKKWERTPLLMRLMGGEPTQPGDARNGGDQPAARDTGP